MADKNRNVTFTAPMLKAMANPLRRQIFDALSAMGTGRAADLGELLQIAPNKVSFHLRELAKAELIEEAPELARDKRDRVWRLVASSYMTGQPREWKGKAPLSDLDAYLSQIALDVQGRLDAALAYTRRQYAQGIQDINLAQLTTSNLLLTDDERNELQRRIDELIPGFRKDLKDGKIPSSQPVSERKLWHYSALLSADEVLNNSHQDPESAS